MTGYINVQQLKECIRKLYGVYTILQPEAHAKINQISDLLVALELLEIINGTNSIAVAGMQGTGKSMLMQTLYDFDNVLNVSQGRGEVIPVIIEEEPDRLEKEAFRVYFDDAGSIKSEKIDVADLSVRSHEKETNVCIKLCVPQQFFYDRGAFILLPGFEKNYMDEWDQKYNKLISLSLLFSNAVILVTDNQSIAENSMEKLCDIVAQSGFKTNNSIFAITKCNVGEEQIPDYAEQQKKSLISKLEKMNYQVSDDRIVCCGYHPYNKEKDDAWKQKLIDALNAIATEPLKEKSRKCLEPVIKDILTIVNEIENDIQKADTDIDIDSEIEIVTELDNQQESNKQKLTDIIDGAIERSTERINRNVGKVFADNGTVKLMKEKKFLVWKKSREKIKNDWEMINRKCKKCFFTDDGGKTIFADEIEKSMNADNYLGAFRTEDGVNNMLLLESNVEENGKKPTDENKQLVEFRNNQIVSLFNKNVEETIEVPGHYYLDQHQVAAVILSEFQTCFWGYFFGAAALQKEEYDNLEKILGKGKLADTEKKMRRMLDNRQNVKAAAGLSALDLLDGKADILSGLGEGIASIMASPAGVFIGGAAAVLSMGCGVVLYHNNNMTLLENGQHATERAMKNCLYNQKDKIISAYDDAYKKMIEHIISVDKQKKHIPENQWRLQVARRAIYDIRNICQMPFDSIN